MPKPTPVPESPVNGTKPDHAIGYYPPPPVVQEGEVDEVMDAAVNGALDEED